MTEGQLQNNIIELAELGGWLWYHTYDSRHSPPGFPDLVLVREVVLHRELKNDKADLDPDQKTWRDRLLRAGADWDLWRPRHWETSIVPVLTARVAT